MAGRKFLIAPPFVERKSLSILRGIHQQSRNLPPSFSAARSAPELLNSRGSELQSSSRSFSHTSPRLFTLQRTSICRHNSTSQRERSSQNIINNQLPNIKMTANDSFAKALSSNSTWSSSISQKDPAFFSTLSKGQSPSILWIGCSDSRCPETTLLGLQPGDVFVHRNIANIVSATDINSAAVIEYAVAHLKVKHVVLCGHTFCGGVAGAMGGGKIGGVLDTWLAPLRQVKKVNAAALAAVTDEKAKAVKLVELNVAAGVETLLGNDIVVEAIKERGLKVHGVVFDIAVGKVRDLGVGNSK